MLFLVSLHRMLFSDLVFVVSAMRVRFPCPHCKGKFDADDIAIIATLELELIALVRCKKCTRESIVHATITLREKRMPHFTHRSISTNEVLDMHNFLKNFNGDFQGLFSRSK